MTAAATAPRRWGDLPLDVDGVLTLADHMAACQRGPGCPICPRDDGRPVTLSGERLPTTRTPRRRRKGRVS